MEKRHIIAKNNSDLEDEIVCPHCNVKGGGLIIEDYTRMHDREVLIECGNCDKLYKVHYKFDRIVKLNEGEKK